MFVMSVKGSHLKLLGGAFVLLVLIAIFFVCVNRNLADSGEDTRTRDYPAGETSAQQLEFLRGFGWETTGSPVDSREVTIPSDFDQVYERYNKIQKKQGFDLSRFKGEKALRYTYEITNYPGHPAGIRATLLVSQGKIIGGDICNAQVENGFLHGFFDN